MQTIDPETHTLVILADFDLRDLRGRRIHFGAAIVGLEDVCKGLHLIRLDLRGGVRIERLREGEFKAVRFGPHLVNLEGNFPGPDETFDGEWFGTA